MARSRRCSEYFGSLIEDELNAHVKERDQNSIVIPNEVIEKFARLGLYKYNLPGRFGGRDAGYYQWGKVLEELGYLSQDTSFPFLISVRMSVITFLIAVDRQGIVDQFVDPLVQGALGGHLLIQKMPMLFPLKVMRVLSRAAKVIY